MATATPPPQPGDDVPVRHAATVLPVREAGGLEVCLLQRNPDSTWVAGLALFPGGAVDERDGHRELHPHLTVPRDGLAGGVAPWVAALREMFEEIGVLLATDADGGWAWAKQERAARLAARRAAIATNQASLAALLADEALTLRVDQLRFFAHWVTPPGQARRYDTRFYLAAVPGDAPITPDGTEIVDAQWITPAQAITHHDGGQLPMLPPTLAALHWLSQYPTVREALAGAEALGEVPRIAPGAMSDAERTAMRAAETARLTRTAQRDTP